MLGEIALLLEAACETSSGVVYKTAGVILPCNPDSIGVVTLLGALKGVSAAVLAIGEDTLLGVPESVGETESTPSSEVSTIVVDKIAGITLLISTAVVDDDSIEEDETEAIGVAALDDAVPIGDDALADVLSTIGEVALLAVTTPTGKVALLVTSGTVPLPREAKEGLEGIVPLREDAIGSVALPGAELSVELSVGELANGLISVLLSAPEAEAELEVESTVKLGVEASEEQV